MSVKPFYLTTAIYYANAAPHIGHAYEIIAADVIARLHRLLGDDVFFLTGMDEHGIKVQKTAEEQGKTPQEFVDGIAEKFKSVWQDLGITQNRFIRTTEVEHYAVVAEMWKRLEAKGDIYKATYTADYCKGCELFLTERDKDEDGKCKVHNSIPDSISEENYFFRLSAYKDNVLELIQNNPNFIQPESRKQEVLNQLEDMQDISVSRARTGVNWGVPVPGDDTQVVYVWIDALSNYLTGVHWLQDDPNGLMRKHWPPDVQIIGKDIMRFHAIYWPAMLMAAELPLPKTLLVHGFINIADTKLSKSSGNIISVQDLVDRFDLPNVDAVRYYLMASTGFGTDGNYSDDDFKAKINADLANNLGNLLNRTLSMLKKYNNSTVPTPSDTAPIYSADDVADIRLEYEQYHFNDALFKILRLVDHANKVVNDAAPWQLFSDGETEKLHTVLYTVLESLRKVAIMMSPVTPTLSQQIWQQLGFTDAVCDKNWDAISEETLPAGQQTEAGQAILPRLESELAGAAKKK